MCLPLLCSSFHSLFIVDGLPQTVPADNTAQTFLFSFPNLRESSLHDYPPSRIHHWKCVWGLWNYRPLLLSPALPSILQTALCKSVVIANLFSWFFVLVFLHPFVCLLSFLLLFFLLFTYLHDIVCPKAPWLIKGDHNNTILNSMVRLTHNHKTQSWDREIHVASDNSTVKQWPSKNDSYEL